MTDIVVSTKNRLPLLQQTLTYIRERTTSPYRLFVIDDASTEGNVAYLQGLLAEGVLAGLYLRGQSEPIGENWNTARWLASSDVIVYTDDDILCPKLEPDWLARGLKALKKLPKLGIMALHIPNNPVHPRAELGPVTLCERVGGHLTFVRRDLMRAITVPPVGQTMEGILIQPSVPQLDYAICRAVRRAGYEVGYLRGVYAQHIGTVSERNQQDLSGRLVIPRNPETLEP